MPGHPGDASPPAGATDREWAWWQEAVFYEIYPRSFCLADADGRAQRLGSAGGRRSHDEGAGDLEGIRRHLDYLSWLGVDALWLCPFQPSPMADLGYDVADYCDVDPLFGTLEDFDRLLRDAHAKGLRVIVDWVPNHTSDHHPWFVDSRSSRDSPRRGWYVWRDGRGPDGTEPPNNWRRSFGSGPAWTFDESTSQWYLHSFLPGQPELDWTNPQLAAAMEGVIDFWLERGVDGFRIDVVHLLGKDPRLPDAPEESARLPWSVQNHHANTHDILRRLRTRLDAGDNEPVSVGEVFLLDTAKVASYCGHDQLHLAFDFTPMFCPFEAKCLRGRIEAAEELVGASGGWPTWVFSSHDRPRHRTRYGGSEAAARAAAVLLLTLRGTPFLFAGEELGLEDAVIAPGSEVDPGGRDGCRAPIPWDSSAEHGWDLGDSRAWLPWPPEAATRNVESERADDRSVLKLYRQLLRLRRASPALRRGSISVLEIDPDLLAFERRHGDEVVLVAVNFSREPRTLPDSEGRVVLVGGAGSGWIAYAPPRFDGVIGPEGAVVLGSREV